MLQAALGNSALKAFIDSQNIYLFIYTLAQMKVYSIYFAKADGFFPLKGVSTHDLKDK